MQRGSLDIIRKEWNENDRNYLLKILSFYKQFLSTRTNIITIDTEHLTPDDIINKIKRIIFDLSDFSFEKMQQPSTTQMNLSEFF